MGYSLNKSTFVWLKALTMCYTTHILLIITPLNYFQQKKQNSPKRKAARALRTNFLGCRGPFRSKNRTAHFAVTNNFGKLGISILIHFEPIFHNESILNTCFHIFLDFNTTYETTCTSTLNQLNQCSFSLAF